MKNSVLLHFVSDYAADGLEFAEVHTRFYHYLDSPEKVVFHSTSTPSLDTISVGFVTAQLALSAMNKRMLVYGNAAPRRDGNNAMKKNQDHGIVYAKLDNDVEVINVNSDFAFGFMKKHIVEFRAVNCSNEGSQFRSRDNFPKAIAQYLNGSIDILGESLDVSDIPEIPQNLVAWIDGFGNIKTSTRRSHLDKMGIVEGDRVMVTLNGVKMEGLVSTGGFTVPRGTLSINLGSSGYDDPFVELFFRVHHMNENTAAVRFNHPEGGSTFELVKI